MAVVAGDVLSPAGSSTYSSDTMYVGDGTWDSTRNDFLLPNLQGLNFATMRYNGMGNRFAGLPNYKSLIKGHAVIAVITFLFIVPAAILIAAYSRSYSRIRYHIYLQILTVLLTTVVFVLGWFAVGPDRSLTNPHHGIGLAIYVLVLWQFLTGWFVHSREKGRTRSRASLKVFIHSWIGRALALLGMAQVPLGLTLYGSPKWTFVLYTLWMAFLLLLFFILSFKHRGEEYEDDDYYSRSSRHGGTVIEDRKKPSRFGGLLGPLALGAGAATLLKSRRDRSRSESRSRVDVIPSRRGSRRGSRVDSDSYVSDEKYDNRRKEKRGTLDKVLTIGAIAGTVGLLKSWRDDRKRKQEGDMYASVAPDTPSRRNDHRRRDSDSDSTESIEIRRTEHGRTHGPILPGPGNPALAASAISAAEPTTPQRVRPGARRDSYDSDSYYDYESTLSPSRRPQQTHKARDGFLGALGITGLMNWRKNRKQKQEEERRAEEEKRRAGQTPQRYTGDGFRPGQHRRQDSLAQSSLLSSDLSTVLTNPHQVRSESIPPVPAGYAMPGTAAAPVGASAAINQSQSRHDVTENVVTDPTAPAQMPFIPHDPQGILHQESGSEEYNSVGGHPHRRHSERRRREGEAAAAAAAEAASALAAKEERRRQRSQSRQGASNVASPPLAVKVKVHDDKDRHVTLRRLTEQEAAAERKARRSRRRPDSELSSLSGTDRDTGASRRRYRRGNEAESSVDVPPPPPPPAMAPLSPPNPAFAAGRRPKDSAYYSGRPEAAGSSGVGPSGVGGSATNVDSPESQVTWSAMSPGESAGDGAEAAAERRRRRRLERNARQGGGIGGTVDFE